MINFYKNVNTNEVIARNELTMIDGWRKMMNTVYVPHSKYHPILDGLENAKVDVEFSSPREETDFIVVPLNLILENIEDRSIWVGCPRLFNAEIHECIEDIKKRGDYPYNSTVAEEFCKRYNCVGGENDFLASVVYTTQSYGNLIDGEIASKTLHETMSVKGYVKLTNELIAEVADTKRKFEVLLDGINIFGSETKMKSDNYLRLKNKNDGGVMWLKPRATRNGFVARIGQYVREI